MTKNRKPILILGIGNILLGDEGIGVHVIETLRHISLSEEVELVDGGTAGADIIDIIADREKIMIVDSMETDDEPGTIRIFSIDDFRPLNNLTVSLHSLGIVETICMTKLLGCAPREVIIFGIKPEKIHCCLELTEKISRKVPKIIELILSEIRCSSLNLSRASRPRVTSDD